MYCLRQGSVGADKNVTWVTLFKAALENANSTFASCLLQEKYHTLKKKRKNKCITHILGNQLEIGLVVWFAKMLDSCTISWCCFKFSPLFLRFCLNTCCCACLCFYHFSFCQEILALVLPTTYFHSWFLDYFCASLHCSTHPHFLCASSCPPYIFSSLFVITFHSLFLSTFPLWLWNKSLLFSICLWNEKKIGIIITSSYSVEQLFQSKHYGPSSELKWNLL